ncbi:MAG: YidC/Oxa1 family membrane protein insertase [Chloroflexota bacterium]
MDFLTNPFTTALLFLYQFLGQNIVLTIVIFTILIRVLTFPLTQQQIKSSKAMQEVQPVMKKLQEKYKGDREKLAAEQMKLYKENNINPLMGCLPLLIQLPILLGLYGAISRALSATPLQLLDLHSRILVPGLSDMLPLHNQFLWLNLALPDQSFILPVLVVVTTYLQSKLMTPPPAAGADPNDPSAAMSRNMTLMMPLMIGMFSLSFASGLSIYWVVSNIAGILQYAMLGKVDIKNLFGGRSTQVVVEEKGESSRKKSIAATSTSTAAIVNDEVIPKKKKASSAASAKPKASKAK